MKQQPAEKDEVVELAQEEIDDRADAVERGEYVDGDEIIRRLRSGFSAYQLTTQQEDAFEESIAQIARGNVNAGLDEAERGEGTDTFEFLKQLREGTWREESDRNVKVPLEKQMTEHALEVENTFELSPEEEADLEAAIAEADAGLLVPLEDVLRRMRERSETKH